MWIKEVHICIVQSFPVAPKMCVTWEQIRLAKCGRQCVKRNPGKTNDKSVTFQSFLSSDVIPASSKEKESDELL